MAQASVHYSPLTSWDIPAVGVPGNWPMCSTYLSMQLHKGLVDAFLSKASSHLLNRYLSHEHSLRRKILVKWNHKYCVIHDAHMAYRNSYLRKHITGIRRWIIEAPQQVVCAPLDIISDMVQLPRSFKFWFILNDTPAQQCQGIGSRKIELDVVTSIIKTTCEVWGRSTLCVLPIW